MANAFKTQKLCVIPEFISAALVLMLIFISVAPCEYIS